MKDRIKKIRSSAKLTQEQFGSKIGVSQNYIWMLETGAREPGDRTVRDICREFGVSESWLRTGEGDMFIPTSREEEMAKLLKDLMADSPDSFRSALITTLLRFRPDGPEWAILETICRSLEDEWHKSKEDREP
jgi:transcriptional regulator with XRE-family HTH domain